MTSSLRFATFFATQVFLLDFQVLLEKLSKFFCYKKNIIFRDLYIALQVNGCMLDPLPPLAVRKSSASSPSNMMETSIDEGIETEELDTEDTHVFNAYQMARFGQRRHTLSEVTNQPGVITSGGGCGLRLMIHWATFWAMLQGNFVKCFCQHATRWDTGSVTNLKYPDRNVLPILNGIVPKQHCSKKVAPSIISLRVTKSL